MRQDVLVPFAEFEDRVIDSLTDAALSADPACRHVDVRVVSTRTAYLSRRDRNPRADVEHRAVAVGVRVLKDGCWGFAATDRLTPAAAAEAALRASALASATAAAVIEPVSLAPEPVHTGEWSSDFEIDPFDVSSGERMEFLTWGCDQLLASPSVDHVDAHVMAVKEEVRYADLAGTRTTQRRIRIHSDFTAVTITPGGEFHSMRTTAPPVGRGWEYLIGTPEAVGGARPWEWAAELELLPDRLAAKAAAPSIEPGRYTLVIDPTNLWLTIHESIGHATELDRVKGYEANYAGTSFLSPNDVGTLRYGSDLMDIQADRTAAHGLATVAWDDEGVAAQQWALVGDGILRGFQLDRAMAAAAGQARSNGCSYADSGSHVPIQRMPNVSLLPDEAGGSLSDLIAGVEDGILVVGDNSWSIDMQRYNFQFTGQRFERIKSGRLAGQVKDVAYQGTTTDFWGSMVALGGPGTYLLGGAFNCGKGQPGQVAPVSHGCPPAVFENVNVLNSADEGTVS
jgi:TldD protein